MKKILTGLKPTGEITFGNYVGSIKQNGGLNISSITDANTIENADNIKQDINAIKGSIVEMGEVVSSVRRH